MSFRSVFAVFLAAASLTPCVRAELVHRWSFGNAQTNNVPNGTALTDSVSGTMATVRGNFARFTGTALTLRGPTGNPTGTTNGQQTSGAISAYVDLPNGIISSKTDLTLELWATPHSARNWMRLVDFGNTNLPTGFGTGAVTGEIIDMAGSAPGGAGASDNLALSFCIGTDLNQQQLLPLLDGTDLGAVNSAVATSANTQYHYVITFKNGAGVHGSGGGQLKWYRNGNLIATRDVAYRLAQIGDVNNWLGRSQYTGDTNAHASYNEFRIYNHALSAAEISASLTAGPDTVVTPPTPDHLWTFTQQAHSTPAAGTTFPDSRGGMVLTLRGNGAALSGSGVTLPGTTTGNAPARSISAYLDLPNGILAARPSVTFEAWASPLSSKNWQRLFDFGRSTTTHGNGAAAGEILDTSTAPGATAGYDNLSLTFNNGGNLNSQQLEGQINGGAPAYTSTDAATTAGTQYHYVLVVEDGVGTYGANGCQVRWYRDGGLQNTMSFPFHLTDFEDVNNWIGRSMYTGDSNSHMTLNELRIYNRALTAGQIAASSAAGPDPSIGPPEPLPPVPVPQSRWSFNSAGSAANGTTFGDAGAGIAATVRGHGATMSGTALVLPGTTTGNENAATIAAYLDFPNGYFSSRPSATYEIWLTPLSSKNWQRIFDFGRCDVTSGPGAQPGEIVDGPTAPGGTTSYDGVMLSLNDGGVLGGHRLEGVNDDLIVTRADLDLSGSTAVGTEYHYALIVEEGAGMDADGTQVRWFRNGSLQGSIDLPYRTSGFSDVNNWIGRSAWSADSNSNIAINDLRVHTRALSVQELLSSAVGGPNFTFAPPVAVADSATIHPNQKVLVDVVKNDTGSPLASTLQIVGPPSTGTATVSGGKILYRHSGSTAAPVTFTYRVGNVSGATADGTVTIHFATSLRLTNTALAMPTAPPATTWQLVNALPGLTFNQPICISSIPGDPRRMFVCERLAKVQHIADVTAASPGKNVFLDLQTVVAGRTPIETIEGGGNAEHGLLGLAFHPQYATNGFFYVAYTVRISGGSYYQRISRFKVSAGDPTMADPTSERILLQQLDEGSNHDGGDLHFGPDGYLYYAAGDEENPNDFRLNSQRINKDFFGGIFRLDVDQKSGNPEPNAHAAIPTDAGVARFAVPIDNPYLHTDFGGPWDGTYNGVAVAPLSGVRTEFWATGLRHVWRMSFDSATGDLWAGDVGQGTYEEVNKVVKGGNYGWVFREGAHNVTFTTPAKPSGFTSIDPVYEYVHPAIAGGDAQFKGNSVVGGYVYRGSRFPALVGTYIFSDSVTGHVWQMNTTTGATVRLTGLAGAYGVISTQGVDPSNRDLLFGAYLTGQIMRLTTGSETTDTFPTTLSATGLFADLTDLSPAPGLIPYEPNMAFWSDHAIKRRWFTIPDAASRMTWSKDDNWTFPGGMLFVKHFDLELNRGNPATKKRIETRILVKNDTGSYGVSYRWNEAQTDATLVENAGVEFDFPVTTAAGAATTQRWAIPSRTNCLTCHNPQAGHVLSFTTRQLNRDTTAPGFAGNQLSLFYNHDFLANNPGSPDLLERHVLASETTYPLEARARSYFAVNCAYCHRTGGSASGFWDGRAHLTLEETGLINGAPYNHGGDPQNKYIVPGDPARSVLLSRISASNGFTRMPPLATSELDQADIALITQWIDSDESSRPLYENWRATFFSGADPSGLRSADPDGDRSTNYQEYLLGTNPLGLVNSAQFDLLSAGGSSQFTFRFIKRAFRRYNILISPDLASWQRWDVPQNTSRYTTSDVIEEIDFTSEAPRYFFRLEVSEP